MNLPGMGNKRGSRTTTVTDESVNNENVQEVTRGATQKELLARVQDIQEKLVMIKVLPDSLEEIKGLELELDAISKEASESNIFLKVRKQTVEKNANRVGAIASYMERGNTPGEIESRSPELFKPIKDPFYARPGPVIAMSLGAVGLLAGGYMGAVALKNNLNHNTATAISGTGTLDNPIKTLGPGTSSPFIPAPFEGPMTPDLLTKLQSEVSPTPYQIAGDSFWNNIYPKLSAADQASILSPYDLDHSHLRSGSPTLDHDEVTDVQILIKDPTSPTGLVAQYHYDYVTKDPQTGNLLYHDHLIGGLNISPQAAQQIFDAANLAKKS